MGTITSRLLTVASFRRTMTAASAVSARVVTSGGMENALENASLTELQAIGTLRASGYTKGELVRHYLSMPVIVTLISALVGNVLGYTVFKDVVVSMYYNSYSLPTYETIWNPDAFFKTTLIPVVLAEKCCRQEETPERSSIRGNYEKSMCKITIKQI